MSDMEILEIPKTTPWEQRIQEWEPGQTIPVAKESASSVRSAISRTKKYIDPKVRFRTYFADLNGREVLMVERLPDAVS